MAGRKHRNEHNTVKEQRIGSDNERVHPIWRDLAEGRFNLGSGGDLNDVDLPPDRNRRRSYVLDRGFGGNPVSRIDEQGEARGERTIS